MIKCIAGAMMIFCTKLVIWHDGGVTGGAALFGG